MPPGLGRGLGVGSLGTMPLGGASYDLASVINQPSTNIFRRVQVKRRNHSDGKYEANWQDVTEFVKKFGTVEVSVDDVRLNRFRHSGVNIVFQNDIGRFNDETNSSSLWFNYMTRYRTLVRVQAGYENDQGELPSDASQGIFLLNDELENDADSNEVVFRCSALPVVFEEVRAERIPGLNATQTASDIITRIMNHSDGSGNNIFREFITSTSWTIQATTNNYLLSTDATLQNMSVMQLMEKLAEAEQFVLLPTRTGGIEFVDRDSRTTTSQFHFYGQGFPDMNIIKLKGEKEAVNKLYTYARLKYLDADTSASYVSAGTTTAVASTNTAWRFGQRTYEFENLFAHNTVTAQAIVDGFVSEFQEVKKEIEFDAKLHPTIQALDRIEVSYRSYDLAFGSLWDVMVWDTDEWSREGNNFDYDAKPYIVLSRKSNLDNFVMTIRAREA